MKERNVAIITARGGSKRIPKKKLRNFVENQLSLILYEQH